MRILVLYASQTGNAENIAKNIYSNVTGKGHDSLGCFCFDEYSDFVLLSDGTTVNDIQISILTEKQKTDLRVVIVSSTTGDGDAPDNSLKWWRYLRKSASSTDFSGVLFTICGIF